MLFPQSELELFVQRYFQEKEKYLKILESSPSPVYLLERDILKERAGRFRKVFEEKLPECAFYFALKSNNHPRVAETLLEMRYGLDVSSGLELEMALHLGAQDVVFSGPGKTDEELALAVKQFREVTVLLDSFQELHRLESMAARHNREIRAGIRLTTNPLGLWRKFGIPLEALPDFFEQAAECRHVRLQGLQFHTSWNLSPQTQIDFIAALGGTMRTLSPSALSQIIFIDVGGGYWPEQGEWLRAEPIEEGLSQAAAGAAAPNPLIHYHLSAASLESFAEELSLAVCEHLQPVWPCRICFEPGRWICNDAMHLLLSVVDRKAPDLVITDAGMNAIGWDRFETDYFPILNLTRPSFHEKACDIMGSLCTPHDVFGYAYFGEDIRPGDILMIPCQGAYTYSLGQAFIKPVPKVVVI